MSVFGTIVLPEEPARAITATLKAYMPDYLAEIGRRTQRDGPLPSIKQWGFGDPDDATADGDLPRVMVECAPGVMVGHGDGYGCQYATEVTVVCRSTHSMTQVQRLAQAYSFVVGLVLVQQTVTVGAADQTQALSIAWQGIDDGIREVATRRWIAQGTASFTVDVPQVCDTDAGPTAPSEDPAVPPGDYPQAETVTFDLNPDEA